MGARRETSAVDHEGTWPKRRSHRRLINVEEQRLILARGLVERGTVEEISRHGDGRVGEAVAAPAGRGRAIEPRLLRKTGARASQQERQELMRGCLAGHIFVI